ncbi:integrator complex subunit 5 [Amia ocellicauda]|uniref:integrator complex subunit 5 n=1 Tax=Amia ocellicauda TaxID=2972642 RepID=UPI00346413BC
MMSAVFEGVPLSAMQSPQQLHTNTISPQELALEIKAFLSGVDQTQGRKLSARDHAKSALRLLRRVPACRGAVLEHLRGVYDEHVAAYLQELEGEREREREREGGRGGGGGGGGGGGRGGRGGMSVSLGLEDVIQEIHGVLSEFIRLNPSAWAPLVSAWAIDLMGQLSSKYSGHLGVPHAASLNELLQLWMGCSATRSLMESYAQCLAALIGSCPDACVDALLDTSVQHSPHFDWVVAHIGSSFPNTIISRVLSCGLKDFCAHAQHSEVGQAPSAGATPPLSDKVGRVPKIGSVVGILGHLASRHSDSIRQELLTMFHGSLSGPREPQRKAAVPFLLQLAALSPPALLGAVSGDLVDSLRPPVLGQLQALLSGLPREELDNMTSLVVHLVCQSSAGALRVLQFLVNTAMPASVIMAAQGPAAVPEGAREACDRVVQLLLLHLQKLVYNRADGDDDTPNPQQLAPGPRHHHHHHHHHGPPHASSSPSPPRAVPFLDALRPHVRELCVETLRLERKRHLWLHQLLSLLAVYCGPSVATEALCHLLSLARVPEELALAAQLHSLLSVSLPGLLPAAVQRCAAQIHTQSLAPTELAQLLLNLATVVQSQEDEGAAGGGGPASMAAQVGAAVSKHLQDFSPLLLHSDPSVSQAAAQLLAASQLPRAVRPAHLLNITRAAVAHFFLALRWEGEGEGEAEREVVREAAVSCSVRLLSRLAAFSPLTLKAVLQQLVEGGLHRGHAPLFGGGGREDGGCPPWPSDAHFSSTSSSSSSCSLLETNRKFGTTVNFSGGVWSVFHAGVIGEGPQPPPATPPPAAARVLANLQTLLGVAVRCCAGGRYTQAEPGGEEPPPINPEAAKVVAVTLVEGVCPDVANSELAWPPEEHARTTVERDIHVRRHFEANPLLFPLLRLVASGRPALCYCSVVLRGLLATLLAHWEASREPHARDSPWHLHASCQLVACMGEGQLLPPALANVHEIFPFLAPFEVRLLLLAVWDYVRGNSPLPQKFTFSPEKGLFYRDFSRDGDPTKYLAPLYSVLHKNIDRLGHQCWRFQI